MWPDNELSVRVFTAMGTQWRVGPGGATGMDYNALSEIWRRLKVPNSERDAVFEDLQVMEMSALVAMNEK